MTTLASLRTQIRGELLRDSSTGTASAKWDDTTLKDYINQALNAAWPSVYVPVTDSTTTTSQTAGISTYTNREYTLPTNVPSSVPGNPVYRVEWGPIGGSRTSDSLAYTDRYRPLRAPFPQEPAWEVDLSRRVLRLLVEPPYDTGSTYTHYLRMYYVRPITALASDTDTLEGPPSLEPFIKEYVATLAFQSLWRPSMGNAELSQTLGGFIRMQRDYLPQVARYCRMQWPRCDGGRLVR